MKKAVMLARTPIQYEPDYKPCICGLMITNEPKERANHQASKHCRRNMEWQDRVKRAKVVLCECGLYLIDAYMDKHAEQDEHFDNIKRRKAMFMEI
jgi:hypothetical protein